MGNGYEVHQMKTSFHMWTNFSYVVVDPITKSAFVVDPAWELSKITSKLYELNVDLVAILLTHSHYDHVNLVDPLVKKYNPNVYMSKSEIDYYQFKCRNLNAINDKEIIQVGNIEIECLLTPGHTVGGMCYLLSDSIFTGDTIFIEGCGICTGDGGSVVDMFESIQKVKSLVSPYVRVYPGHSYGKVPGQTLECLRKENIYFQLDKKEYFISFRMRKNQKGIFDFK
ncbi:MBL fold metallo-hydrolase [Hazenella coriacea]|uniref:Glyoxylase-like metal-dependent hydrolase (Beta-lactamase superfamily II) n=1 Tax=Hazenella coriacea TaxID=1179467 RepID=A0A4R3L335_9BACL|nr:MBL fold metallo-hydrolase [Hazenella coriacea]TCS93642.1 glyoxylase-like metal-dependent hydrolase (beta-lactamase superfamily II) [Hazenella coriacea]